MRHVEYYFEQLVMKKSAHVNCIGMKAASLPLITKPPSPEISAISGWNSIRYSGLRLNKTGTDPTVIQYNQATTKIEIWGQGERNVSLVSLEISPYV